MPPLFPEQLYELSARDRQVTWLDPFYQRATQAAAAVNLSLVWGQVPEGRVLFLQSLAVRVIPAAPLIANSGWAGVQVPGASVVAHILTGMPFTTPPTPSVFMWQGSILVPPRWQFEASVDFSGVGAHVIEGFAIGVLVPIGNIQRV
jgi:hypothetical protein